MKKVIALLIMLSFVMPVRVFAGDTTPVGTDRIDLTYREPAVDNTQLAALDLDFVPVERKLIDEQKEQEEILKSPEKKKTKWWVWALGIVAVGAVAAAAGGGGGGGGTATSTTGSSTVTW